MRYLLLAVVIALGGILAGPFLARQAAIGQSQIPGNGVPGSAIPGTGITSSGVPGVGLPVAHGPQGTRTSSSEANATQSPETTQLQPATVGDFGVSVGSAVGRGSETPPGAGALPR
jgi:hypothetical protein